MPTNGAQQAHAIVPDGSLAPEQAPFKVLVLDGHGFFSHEVETGLENEGHLIAKAASAEDAVSLAARFRPDLILLDNGVEGASGRALLDRLLIEQPGAGVVILAAHPRITEAVEAIRLGATDYVEGPLELESLKRTIESLRAFL